MRFLHSMIRVKDLDRSLHFYCDLMGLSVRGKKENPKGQFTLVFLKANEGDGEIELTYNWDSDEQYSTGRNFGHLAFEVENIYEFCQKLMDKGVDILRPPRDGHMAFIKCPDQISIELLQKGDSLPAQEPWASMENQGSW